MAGKRILMLAQESEFTNFIYNSINPEHAIDNVFLESPEPRGKFLKRRVQRMGLAKVVGQLLFLTTLAPILRRQSAKRVEDIKEKFALNGDAIYPERIVRVRSINSKRTREMLQEIDPDVILVVGTRIISKRILTALSATFINIHCGITPLYRGAHGGYWALVQNDREGCGVTVHHVDPGIDTGEIIAQGIIEPTGEDNYCTYPYLQFAVGAPLMKSALEDALNKRLKTKPGPPGESLLWSHPTIGEYISNRLRHRVR